MQLKKNIAILAVATTTAMAYYVPPDPWSTLKPTATYPGGATNYPSSFGLAVQPIATVRVKRDVVSQIGDGQIQATTKIITTLAPKPPITQINDGQIQAPTKTPPAPPPITQITDGQIQAPTETPHLPPPVSQIIDGQPQVTKTKTSHATHDVNNNHNKACRREGTLVLTLQDGILTDALGRIGSIVANRQFQFDGPPPQAGAIYAAGWSVTPHGLLALGDKDVFFQCLSGDFFNLYDESIGEQCTPVQFQLVELLDC